MYVPVQGSHSTHLHVYPLCQSSECMHTLKARTYVLQAHSSPVSPQRLLCYGLWEKWWVGGGIGCRCLECRVPTVPVSRQELVREELRADPDYWKERLCRAGCSQSPILACSEYFLQPIYLSNVLCLCQPGPGVLSPP